MYLHFNKDQEIVYVGIASHTPRRTRAHERDSPWFDQVDTIKMLRFDTRLEAQQAEILLIKTIKPHYNIEYKNDKCVDDEMKITSANYVSKILKSVQQKTREAYEFAGMQQAVNALDKYSYKFADNDLLTPGKERMIAFLQD